MCSGIIWELILYSSYLSFQDERGRLLRRSFARYINLAFALAFARISPRVARNLSTYQKYIDAGVCVYVCVCVCVCVWPFRLIPASLYCFHLITTTTTTLDIFLFSLHSFILFLLFPAIYSSFCRLYDGRRAGDIWNDGLLYLVS